MAGSKYMQGKISMIDNELSHIAQVYMARRKELEKKRRELVALRRASEPNK